MRIAILDKDRCHPRKCSEECIKYCPKVRTGDETVTMGEDGKAVISEELCVGCGICIKKCPEGAIMIIGLPDELEDQLTHRYGSNGFALYGLPIPSQGRVSGILGVNGIGKSTAVKILSGQVVPNLGKSDTTWEDVYKFFAGSELQDYMRRVSTKKLKTSQKPQYVDLIPKAFKGKVSDLLKKTDERGAMEEMVKELDLARYHGPGHLRAFGRRAAACRHRGLRLEGLRLLFLRRSDAIPGYFPAHQDGPDDQAHGRDRRTSWS